MQPVCSVKSRLPHSTYHVFSLLKNDMHAWGIPWWSRIQDSVLSLISGQGTKISRAKGAAKKKNACVSRHRMILENQVLIDIVDQWNLGCSCPSSLYTLNYLNFYIEHIVNLTIVVFSGTGGLIQRNVRETESQQATNRKSEIVNLKDGIKKITDLCQVDSRVR